jgi:hypothetical protein
MDCPKSGVARQAPFQWDPSETADGTDVSDVLQTLRNLGECGIAWVSLQMLREGIGLAFAVIGFAVCYVSLHVLAWMIRDFAATVGL